MDLRDTIPRLLLNKSRRERLDYWRSVSLTRLWPLAAAAFFLFAVIGLLVAMQSGLAVQLVAGFASAIFSGTIAVFYILAIARKPSSFPILIVVQIAATKGLTYFQLWASHHFAAVPYVTAIHIYSIVALTSTAAAYACFFIFIQTEGRVAIRAQTELALAHSIQQTLVPVIDVVHAGCEIYGISAPSEKVGGDLVDVVAMEDGSAIAYVADIAGHGLQAGILMGMVKTAARTRLMDMPTPAALFETLNHVLPGVKEVHMYATSVALRLEPGPDHTCRVAYALAGHPAILHLRAATASGNQLADQQFPLGIMPEPGYRSLSVVAAQGDLFIASTDGILEICNKNGDEFGHEGLLKAAVGSARAPLAELAATILAAARKHGAQDDDQTLLLIRVL